MTPAAAAVAVVGDGGHGDGRDGARNGGSCRGERRMTVPPPRHHMSGRLDPCPLLRWPGARCRASDADGI